MRRYKKSPKIELPNLKNISLYQFKNHSKVNYATKAPIVCISGINGKGKTNILDAIYALCFTKSYFSSKDQFMVQQNSVGMNITGLFETEGKEEQISLIIRETGKKELVVDGLLQKGISNFIGKHPCVFIGPDDIELITEGGELRRKFMDGILSQTKEGYLDNLLRYGKVMQQRNALFKNCDALSSVPMEVLNYYNQELGNYGHLIYEARKQLCFELLPLITKEYEYLSNQEFKYELILDSKLENNNLLVLFKQSIEKDFLLNRTSFGIHKDDIIINKGSFLFKETASQGEKKTMLFAFKLAMATYLQQKLNIAPLLLLDDVFEKLDANRMQNLLTIISKRDAQTFITDTHKGRLEETFVNSKKEVIYIDL